MGTGSEMDRIFAGIGDVEPMGEELPMTVVEAMMIIKTTFTDLTDEALMDYMDAILNVERATRGSNAYAEVADSIDALDIEIDRRYDVYLAGIASAKAKALRATTSPPPGATNDSG
jgi:hypothetical protein